MDGRTELGGETTYDRSPGRAGDGAFLTAPSSVARVRAEVVSFVRQRIDDTGAAGVVVPMSGGIDSTVTAAVAAEALPPDRVLALGLPCHETEDFGTTDVRTVATGLGVEYREIRLQPLLDRFEAAVASEIGSTRDRTAIGNALARLRMTCAYYAANTRSYLVLGTANRSELLLGYFTKHGDGGADLYPLGDLYKTEVRALAPAVGIPQRIIAKEPTAGFWADQTDASELGASYDVLDRLLLRLVDRDEPPDVVADDLGLAPSFVGEVLERCAESAHKRTSPPKPGIDDRVHGP
jgi:NAD+ synthase